MIRINTTAAILFFVGLNANATTINFASGDGIGESNSVTGTNVLINVNAAWQPNGVGKWISYADTGSPGTVSPPNTSIAVPTALFFENFELGSGVHTATFSVWADDTASVAINGLALLPSPNPSQGGSCAVGPIGCTPVNGFTFHITDTDGLKTGGNILTITAYQRGSGPFGVLYQGTAVSALSLNIEASPVPEPESVGLLAAGLIMIGCWRRKRA